VTIDYVVKIIDLGPSEPLSTLIYDFSGSSYHTTATSRPRAT